MDRSVAPRRVVWVTTLPPDHEGTGGQLRQAHLLDAVTARAPVVLVSAGAVRDPAVAATASVLVEVTGAPAPPTSGPRLRAELLAHWLLARHPLPATRARTVRASLRRELAGVVQPDDVVVLEHLELAPLAAHLPPHARTLLTVHHAAARQASQELELAATRRQRSWCRRERDRARRLERWAGEHVDTVVTVSTLDAQSVACPSVVVPNGTAVSPEPTPPPRSHVVVFTGDLAYGPNVDSITWFARTAWPLVRAAVPDARLDVVGRSPSVAVRDLAQMAGIEVYADVPTIAPHLAGADVAVVPLRLGGGTRLKALQAMAAGRPVVGTSVGLEGLDVQDGVQARVADGADALATAVVDLLTDPAAAAELAGRAHDWVREHHDWQRIGRRFAEDVLGL